MDSGLNLYWQLSYYTWLSLTSKRVGRTISDSGESFALRWDDLEWTDTPLFRLPSIRDAMEADTGYAEAQLVYATTFRLPREFVDYSFSSMKMDLNSYTRKFTNTMCSAKTVCTTQQSDDFFVQPALRHSTHVFVCQDSFRRPLKMAHEGPFKVFHRKPKCDIINKNGTNENVGINRLGTAFSEWP